MLRAPRGARQLLWQPQAWPPAPQPGSTGHRHQGCCWSPSALGRGMYAVTNLSVREPRRLGKPDGDFIHSSPEGEQEGGRGQKAERGSRVLPGPPNLSPSPSHTDIPTPPQDTEHTRSLPSAHKLTQTPARASSHTTPHHRTHTLVTRQSPETGQREPGRRKGQPALSLSSGLGTRAQQVARANCAAVRVGEGGDSLKRGLAQRKP